LNSGMLVSYLIIICVVEIALGEVQYVVLTQGGQYGVVM
jgi:hypothetical protein